MNRVLAVIVLYNKSFSQSATVKSVIEAGIAADARWSFVIYDNSPAPCAEPKPFDFEYVSDSVNSGICTAYNYALKRAAEQDCDCLLLLDHDTELGADFFAAALDAADNMKDGIVAVVPQVLGKSGERLSPSLSRRRLRDFVIKPRMITASGTYEDVTAINSGALVSVDFLQSTGGFCVKFPLDWLDVWMFNEISLRGGKVAVLDKTIAHDLSLTDKKNYVSVARYKSIMRAFVLFANNFVPRREKYGHLAFLALIGFKRILRGWIRLGFITAGYWFRLLFSRSRFDKKKYREVERRG